MKAITKMTIFQSEECMFNLIYLIVTDPIDSHINIYYKGKKLLYMSIAPLLIFFATMIPNNLKLYFHKPIIQD